MSLKDMMDEVVICKHCGKPEYYGQMRWLNGTESCRDCYKEQYEAVYREHYRWDDLDGVRPTANDYRLQGVRVDENMQ